MAKRQGIITLASATRSGSESQIPFPACLHDVVFGIGSADEYWTPSRSNAKFTSQKKYSAFGEFVEGGTIQKPNNPKSVHDSMIRYVGSRPSVAIATGIAALLLEYTSQFLDIVDAFGTMQKLFKAISEPFASQSYRYLSVIWFCDQDGSLEERIKAVLAPMTSADEGIPPESSTDELLDNNWTTGKDPRIVHLRPIDKGGFGEVHKVWLRFIQV